jgi:hypothetical protein
MMGPFILYTLKSSLILGGGYILYFLLFRKATFYWFNRFLLLGIICTSLVVPLIKIHTKTAVPANPIQKLETVFAQAEPSPMAEETILQPRIIPQPRITKSDWAGLVYFTGAAIQLIMILISFGKIFFLLKKSRRIIYNGNSLVVVPKNIIPFCFGRRIFISERSLNEQGNTLILHERTHQEKFHTIDLFLVELYLVMTWYSPFSWMIRHDLKQNHEFEADNTVLRQGVDESGYQLLLVRTAAGEHRFHLANQFNQSSIKNRIRMMNKKRSNPLGILKALAFIPLIVLMIQAFAQKETFTHGQEAGKQLSSKYLELTPDQMKLLGFDYNSSGLYYKNIRADRKNSTLCCYFTEKEYSANIILHKGEKISGHSPAEKVLKEMPVTQNDFYPILVSAYSGFRTLDMIGKEKDPGKEFLPVQFNMGNLNLGQRKDTLVFWFPLTVSLKQTLVPVTAHPEAYLKPIPPEPERAGKK